MSPHPTSSFKSGLNRIMGTALGSIWGVALIEWLDIHDKLALLLCLTLWVFLCRSGECLSVCLSVYHGCACAIKRCQAACTIAHERHLLISEAHLIMPLLTHSFARLSPAYGEVSIVAAVTAPVSACPPVAS
jgi:hypothetical protein